MLSRLADVTGRVDRLVRQYEAAVKAILDGSTHEGSYVGALFDRSDDHAMGIYRELGIVGDDGGRDGILVLDVLHQPLLSVLGARRLIAIDELPVPESGTVLLYVLTLGAVVARRFEAFVQPVPNLREVKRARDIELPPTGLRVEGAAAREVLVQLAAPTLRKLMIPGADRVAWIERVSHGAKVGTVLRPDAIAYVRSVVEVAKGTDRGRFSEVADALAVAREGKMACLLQGWPGLEIVHLDLTRVPANAVRDFGEDDAREMHAYIVACRDRERALSVLRKCAHDAASTPAAAPLEELIAFASEHWEDCGGILARLVGVTNATTAYGAVVGPVKRLRTIATALYQATLERKRGGAVNARGGDG